MAYKELRISVTAVSHSQVNVLAGNGQARTYPTHEAFFTWVTQVQGRLPADARLVVEMPLHKNLSDHPADLQLRKEIRAAGITVH